MQMPKDLVYLSVGCLPALLDLYWGLAAGAAVAALLPIPRLQPFRAAVLLTASRGKTWRRRPKGARKYVTDLSVPQSYFLHFYAVGIVASLLVLQTLLVWRLYGSGSGHMQQRQGASAVALAACMLHVWRRFLETAFLLTYPPDARMHIVAYIFALSYYMVAPMSLVPPEMYSPDMWHPGRLAPQASVLQLMRAGSGSRTTTGAAIFCLGSVLQLHSHAVLARIAGTQRQKRGSHYFIPEGGGFEFVSCPHYLAEILIYLGLAMMTGPEHATPWLMLVWVAANLLLAARPMHRWYLAEFTDYPVGRKAIIPGIY